MPRTDGNCDECWGASLPKHCRVCSYWKAVERRDIHGMVEYGPEWLWNLACDIEQSLTDIWEAGKKLAYEFGWDESEAVEYARQLK